ncbi:DUF5752 family protein [Desulfuromonas sp. AOP6]|uniref:DUF5752 family protein n=1 Tax=Desulfuromonas sp. AOP6 TaxID=1566351 RepID=UPI001289D934|nr:DUF5752 family protein [Desulfuromonas sp. AOP6]BCA81132.1 hypothetical protein AOP6_2919 [Desulfuromonas sp. AOP6]
MAKESKMHSSSTPFALKDCALITLATGIKAQNLREFSDGLQKAPPSSLIYHFWGRLLTPKFDEPEYNNDFASWAYHGLHDKPLAERLSMVIPTDFSDLEALRREIVEVVEQRLDESEMVPWAKADQQFHFQRSQIVVFDTGQRFATPKDILQVIPTLSTGSIYYHFIDARGRTEGHLNDFTAWLEGFGEPYLELCHRLSDVDPFFSSLKEIRSIVHGIFQSCFEEGAR